MTGQPLYRRSDYVGGAFRCGHPKSPENTRTRTDGRTCCRECDRAHSRRWKDKHREQNRARDREMGHKPCPECGGPMVRQSRECLACHGVLAEVRRTLAEGMWADAWTVYEIADAFGVTKDRIGIEVSRWRRGGYLEAFPYRRTPEQVERITAGWQQVADRRSAA